MDGWMATKASGKNLSLKVIGFRPGFMPPIEPTIMSTQRLHASMLFSDGFCKQFKIRELNSVEPWMTFC